MKIKHNPLCTFTKRQKSALMKQE